ncbi:two-component system, OmpR family, phosphate regulon response regulator PhoB/two-component system, OmpR family, response regulator VicR [Mucilaginibacter gossypiicola]|uniref:Two-component system, OmpR family, phosphate regulon response regulator PhoB/two-component system, OmpR family, response regulator VicR n=1 Tax=Mucilaginibacter gossypiicola TaxID=551995 RepID=A0A1H8KSV7_9SPHI|nr:MULTISPECIES: response regulator [Mucilaginibacter]SEN95498.1 two-component system, OmpR family, phosphate regulon response regulator PhoB/two-component system, OmpR family, response regulator VicR [Mucilaginibacter gossypiicola]
MSKKILVIDDDEDILEILNIVFQESGYDVVLSNTGEAAGYIQVIHPDLILLDVNIVGSGKSGSEICREIKSNYETASLPVMLVSAETDLDLIAAGCGANAFVRKPFDIYELLMHVKQYLS